MLREPQETAEVQSHAQAADAESPTEEEIPKQDADGRIKAFWKEWDEDEDARVMEDAEQDLQGIEDPDTRSLAETYLNFKRMQAGIQ